MITEFPYETTQLIWNTILNLEHVTDSDEQGSEGKQFQAYEKRLYGLLKEVIQASKALAVIISIGDYTICNNHLQIETPTNT